MGKTYWSLGVEYQKADNAPVKPEIVVQDIDKFIQNGETGYEIEKSYLKKYNSGIDSIFNNMQLVGTTLGEFVYMRSSEVPIRICSYNETSKLCFITGIALQDVYNTLRLTSRQRATKVITSYLLPSLKNLKPLFNKEFQYIGLGAQYGSKNLADKYALTKAEYILIIVSTKKASDFVAGKITEDELVASADIISSDADMVTGTKKIKITLE